MSTLPLPEGYEAIQDFGPDAVGRIITARTAHSGEAVRLRYVAYPSPDDAQQAAERASALTEHTHENLLTPLSVHAVEEYLVCVQPSVEEMVNLAPLLHERGTLSVPEVQFITERIGAGLLYAHENGCVHGALTPGCVHLSQEGSVLLSDVGIAAIHPAFEGVMLGVRPYQDDYVDSQDDLAPRTDTHTLAALATRMLVGEVPRDAQHWAESAHQRFDQAIVRCFVEALMKPAMRPSLGVMLENFTIASGGVPTTTPETASSSTPDVAQDTATATHTVSTESLPGQNSDEFALTAPPSSSAVPLSSDESGEENTETPPSAPTTAESSEEHADATPGHTPSSPPESSTRRRRSRSPIHEKTTSQRRVPVWAVWGGVIASALLILGGGAGWWFLQQESPTPQHHATESTQVPSTQEAPSSSPPTASASPSPTPAPYTREKWGQVIITLDKQRSEAFAQADTQKLRSVYTSESALLRVDVQQVKTLQEDNVTMHNVRHRIEVQKILRGGVGESEVILEVRDGLDAYTLRDAEGKTLREVPAAELRTLYMTLMNTDAGWRIHAVSSSRPE